VVTTDPAALLILLYLGAITMALAYGLLYAGLRTTTSSTAVVATLLEPVTAAAMAALFLGEALRPAGVVGSLLILLALAGSARPNPATPGSTKYRCSATPTSRRECRLRTFPVEAMVNRDRVGVGTGR